MNFADEEVAAPLHALVKIGAIRDLDEGILPQRLNITGNLPILQKNESIVWGFAGVSLHEFRTKTSYVGGSQGVSLRIMKGVYYRIGAYKGERLESTHLKHIDDGMLFLTNKNLYFVGAIKSHRLPYPKIVAAKLYLDGLQITRESVNPKPQVFVFEDAEFAINLLSRLVAYPDRP
jgi:hypothetical protein